ncbi:MAG: transglycosylase domain-containing protein [Gammaproteobacteria bacterium]|nr:transglycosylase domain-containing protein [Gammaproteobacteria bacterium]
MLRQFRQFINHFLLSLMVLMALMAITFGGLYAYMEFDLPDVTVLNDVHMQIPLRIYSADSQLIAEYGAKRRAPVTIDQVPKQLIQAILATEDARFYSHPGVDFIGIVRAAIAVIATGHKVQGASTITMQVARNFFLTPKKTYTRKIKEILLAIKIDKTFSKAKILELYLNKVYFGSRAYGVSAAAHVYYGKSLNQLTLPQMAMIAGLPQAPSRNNPMNNPANALIRRNHVLERMHEVGYINKATYETAITAPITARYHAERPAVQAPYLAEMVRESVMMMYGARGYDSGVKVYTTISSQLQSEATQSLQSGLIAYSNRHGFRKSTVNLGIPSAENQAVWQTWLENQPKIDGMQMALVLSTQNQQATILLGNGDTAIIPWAGLAWAKPALAGGYVGSAPKTANQILASGDAIYVTYLSAQNRWQLTQVPQAQGAMVVLNPNDGAILALQGGFDFHLSAFNRVLQAQRQPGSSFKPFVYSAAFDKGYTLASTINDAPIMIRDSGENTWWRPENDTQQFYGPTRLRVALAQSRNLVSIRLLQAIGIPYTLDYLQRFGFNPNQLPHQLSLALGSGVITPMQEAAGYSKNCGRRQQNII